eukprot:TRINITY_DN6890_c0_g1_i2.p3 TRINITY_DN6890_c0_g1~~TRINITY_DN6890_c0_g1_i2.p3  ORF type:complete len:105 (+),score=7.08 TRINITY_DN6890_c0_g1_i2:67-381(+)
MASKSTRRSINPRVVENLAQKLGKTAVIVDPLKMDPTDSTFFSDMARNVRECSKRLHTRLDFWHKSEAHLCCGLVPAAAAAAVAAGVLRSWFLWVLFVGDRARE